MEWVLQVIDEIDDAVSALGFYFAGMSADVAPAADPVEIPAQPL
jgi:hypothetical protein